MLNRSRVKEIKKSVTCYKVLKKIKGPGGYIYTSPEATRILFQYPQGKTIYGRFDNSDISTVPNAVKDGIAYETAEGYLHAFLKKSDAMWVALLKNRYDYRKFTKNKDDEEFVVCKMKIPTIAKFIHYGTANYGYHRLQSVAARRMKMVKEVK